MAYLLLTALIAVLALYGRSVVRSTGHSLDELMRFLTLTLGFGFVLAMLALLYYMS